MGNYKLWNLVLGWFSFLVALITYTLTMERTASFWDCGEFIASAYGLQVGHPPGAPLFAMIGRIFSMFASSPADVALMINAVSALASAFTIGFLFWTITAIVKKIYFVQNGNKPFEWDASKMIATLGSGLLGALAYTFSDTFWFSAVEGEVYATSSLFTAVVFWAILRWDQVADQPHADRWIILIAYLMGLSIGVHLLNLLTIPAIGFVYYFRKYKVSMKGVLATAAASMGALLFIQYLIIPRTVWLASKFEKLFTNSLGMGFGTGFFFYVAFVFLILAAGIFYTMRKGYPKLNLAFWCVTVIIVGYSSYGMIVIRSLANTPMDENNPENVFSLISYLNREQYGDRPLFYGPYYTARPDGTEPNGDVVIKAFQVVDGKDVKGTFTIYYDAEKFVKDNGDKWKIRDQYVVTDQKIKYTYPAGTNKTLLPRMWSGEGRHRGQYEYWGGVARGSEPSFINNMRFLFRYQINWMYWRYFMWNFSGRENDLQGNGEALNGHWLTGFKFIDQDITGVPQHDIPRAYSENKGRNKYYMLPLLLGLIGLFFHFRSDWRGATVVSLLFFLTGLAIVIYLNQTPLQPRERDYAYAGSFYAFAIWIGLAVAGIVSFAKKTLATRDFAMPIVGGCLGALVTLIGFLSGSPGMGFFLLVLTFFYVILMIIPFVIAQITENRAVVGILATGLCILIGPVIMAFQNWDDHYRGKRYTARDFAYNYLNSCAPNAILFTNGDNDTFPLWYLQEVEGVRRDVRIVNLSLLNTDWYITQMKRAAYEGLPVPFSLTEQQYRQGERDAVLIVDNNPKYLPIKDQMEFIKRSDGTNVERNSGLKYFLSNKFSIPVDSAKVIANGFVPKGKEKNIVKSIDFVIPLREGERARITYLNSLMILDLLSNFNWDRPIYFSMTVGGEYYEFLSNYLQLEGLAYKLVPYQVPGKFGSLDKINVEASYKMLMETFKWGNFNGKGVYLDETNARMVGQFKLLFMQTATKAFAVGDTAKSIALVDRMIELMPDDVVPYDPADINISDLLIKLGQYDKAETYTNTLRARMEESATYLSLVEKTDKTVKTDREDAEEIMRYCDAMLERIASIRSGKGDPLDKRRNPVDSINAIMNDTVLDGAPVTGPQ